MSGAMKFCLVYSRLCLFDCFFSYILGANDHSSSSSSSFSVADKHQTETPALSIN